LRHKNKPTVVCFSAQNKIQPYLNLLWKIPNKIQTPSFSALAAAPKTRCKQWPRLSICKPTQTTRQ
jgi:hypothetical protein